MDEDVGLVGFIVFAGDFLLGVDDWLVVGLEVDVFSFGLRFALGDFGSIVGFEGSLDLVPKKDLMSLIVHVCEKLKVG